MLIIVSTSSANATKITQRIKRPFPSVENRRNIAVPDDAWAGIRILAVYRGVNTSEIVTQALREFLERNPFSVSETRA